MRLVIRLPLLRSASLLVMAGLLAPAVLVPAARAHRSLSDAPRFAAEADKFVQASLESLEIVPGLAMAVVVDDEVVLARGWGEADREAGVPSSGDVVYYIASATKPFTALAVAILAARGEIDLSSPLAEHMSGLSLAAELRADEVKLRDLLTHTSGVSNGPIAVRVAYTGQHDPGLLWGLLDDSEPNEDAPLGTFQYTNVGYNILSMILDRETGKPWQDHLRDEIFRPLGMERTTAYASRPRGQGWPLAAPYFGLDPDGIRRLYLEKQDNTMQSAGGMMTTARDLGRWLELQINDGRVDGRQLVDASLIRATHEPLTDATGGRSQLGQRAYGLGWWHGAHAGQRVLHHAGGFPGFASVVSFMPEARVGVAVLVNEGALGVRIMDLFALWAYDWWLDTPAAERAAEAGVEEVAGMICGFRERMASELAERAKREWQLSRELDTYSGRFANELWGTVDITLSGSRLEMSYGNLHCVTEPYPKPETARVELIPGSGRVVVFEPKDGPVERIVLDGDVFERVD